MSGGEMSGRQRRGEVEGVKTQGLHWAPWQRVAFRFVASYLLLSWLTVYGVLQVIPWIGFRLEGWVETLWGVPVQWVGAHVFHLAGVAAHFHASDSRDTALNWVAAGLVLPLALVVAALWSWFDRRRANYVLGSTWLRYILRLALIFLLLRYAVMKIFPLQMMPPSLAVLNEPVGSTSPMTLFWTAVGLHPGYEMVAGWVEAFAAVLLLWRRTALIGALLAIVVMTNVLIDNLFFDIPVKIGAANMLILAIVISVPDWQNMLRIFVKHESTVLDSQWAPWSPRPRVRIAFRAVELFFFVAALIQFVPSDASAYRQMQANLRHPSVLTGLWHVNSVVLQRNGVDLPLPVLTGLGQPVTDISFDPSGAVMARSQDGMLWRAFADIDPMHHTVALGSGYFEGVRFETAYTFKQPDANHLILTPGGEQDSPRGTMSLTRVPLPAHYPLLERGFSWVNEWALER